MTRTRVFMSGRSQHVTIPKEFRFRTSTVSIRRDPNSGDVILSEVPSIDEVFAALDAAKIPEDFCKVKIGLAVSSRCGLNWTPCSMRKRAPRSASEDYLPPRHEYL